MAGICRGGQFLNVMNGGSMHQHIEGHTQSHYITLYSGREIPVSSTHHQMMIPGCDGIVKAWADICTQQDAEVIIYPTSNCLCFQPHPEFFSTEHPCQEYYFNVLSEVLYGYDS